MKKIKSLLANSRPRIMREVMKQLIRRQPDMEIVREVLDLSALIRTAKETAADVIIVALEDSVALGLKSRQDDHLRRHHQRHPRHQRAGSC